MSTEVGMDRTIRILKTLTTCAMQREREAKSNNMPAAIAAHERLSKLRAYTFAELGWPLMQSLDKAIYPQRKIKRT